MVKRERYLQRIRPFYDSEMVKVRGENYDQARLLPESPDPQYVEWRNKSDYRNPPLRQIHPDAADYCGNPTAKRRR